MKDDTINIIGALGRMSDEGFVDFVRELSTEELDKIIEKYFDNNPIKREDKIKYIIKQSQWTLNYADCFALYPNRRRPMYYYEKQLEAENLNADSNNIVEEN